MLRIVLLLKRVIDRGQAANADQAAVSPDASARIHPLMYIPVPWVFVLAYLAGVGLHRAFPSPLPSALISLIARVAGGILMFCGAGLALWCLGLFRAARTTTVPGEASHELVEAGPYRYSRNPMYVSLTLVYLGEAGILIQAWPLLMLPLVLLYLNQMVIPIEEARLRQVFGNVYERYCARVRRWI